MFKMMSKKTRAFDRKIKLKPLERKGLPVTHHSEIQWASSTTASDINALEENMDVNSEFKNLSGDTNRT